jgi:hypothetical protein
MKTALQRCSSTNAGPVPVWSETLQVAASLLECREWHPRLGDKVRHFLRFFKASSWETVIMAYRACHFVRPHTRFRFGKIEDMCGYWRCCG